MEASRPPDAAGRPAAGSTGELAHVTQEMYKKNLELSERNKTLSLLRKIDEIVLSTVTSPSAVADKIVKTVVADTDFALAALFLAGKKKAALVPYAISNKSGKIGEIEARQKLLKVHLPLRSASTVLNKAITQKKIQSTDQLLEIVEPRPSADQAKELRLALGTKIFLICPLVARGELLGVMVVGSRASELSAFQHSLIERLTAAIGIAMDNTLLYQKAQDATKRLRVANRHLKELDEAKDEFISMASHQLRTPLTTIKGYLSMLLEGDAGKVVPQQREFLEYAFGGSQRMVDLISDLLNVSRMSAGRFMIDQTSCDLTAVVAEEVRQLHSHATAKQLALKFVPPTASLPPILLDEGKTRQVVMNFIDNAIYYTKRGGITVTLQKQGDSVELRVVDTGIGVPKAAQKQLFGKFYRAHNAQIMRPDGTGLGLFLAKRVIEDQGGTIVFESVEGKGSTFGFRLPFKPAPASTKKRR